MPALDLRPGGLDEPVVLHARTGRPVTQAMQPRQASKWPTIESVIGSPWQALFIR